MLKLTKALKILLLLPLLFIAIPIDGMLFAFANTCSSCSSFSQYLLSSVSLFNAFWLSFLGLLLYFKRKKTNQ